MLIALQGDLRSRSVLTRMDCWSLPVVQPTPYIRDGNGNMMIITATKLFQATSTSLLKFRSGLRTQLLGNAAKEGKGSAGRKRSCLLLRIQDTHLLNMLVSDGLAAHTFAQNYFCSCTPPRAAETLSGNNGLSGTVHSCRKVFPFACLGDSLYVMYLQAVVKLLSDG